MGILFFSNDALPMCNTMIKDVHNIQSQLRDIWASHLSVPFPLREYCVKKRPAAPCPMPSLVTTRVIKKFEGDNWKPLVEKMGNFLRHTFILEASCALQLSPKCISHVKFRLGSLYVTFHVTHDEDVTEEEINQRIEEYPFREMWRLFNQRDGPIEGIDYLHQRIRDLEEEGRQKDCDLEQAHHRMTQLTHELEGKLGKLQAKLIQTEDREQNLLRELGKEQQACEKADMKRGEAEEANKKLLESLQREKKRSENILHRQNELIATIIQENKKEKEAKDREYNEQLDLKDCIIESLKIQLRTRLGSESLPRFVTDGDRSDEFSEQITRMEEMASALRHMREAENEARSEVKRLTQLAQQAEEARRVEREEYERNSVALRQQLSSLRNIMSADGGGANGADWDKKQEKNKNSSTVMETLVGVLETLQERLSLFPEEFVSSFKATSEEINSEASFLKELKNNNKSICQAFYANSIALQKIFWETEENGVRDVIHNLDCAAADAEKVYATVSETIAILDSKKKSLSEQKGRIATHHQSLQELISSLQLILKRILTNQVSSTSNKAMIVEE